MTFDEILEKTLELLQRRGRVSYRALKIQFNLDDEYLKTLKDEIVEVLQLAVDQDGKMLVWAGKTIALSEPASQPPQTFPQLDTQHGRPAQTQRIPTGSHLDEAERRQLTVMFCDVVGSTALSARLDPEELRQVMQAYQQACVNVITRFDGHVAKYLGDGLLVYFGYPTAHEDDAARAVRAGLEIVTAIQESSPLNTRLSHPLQVRVGIHTGLVVAGEMGSGDYREQLAIVGETPNVAARLQEKALPNSVVISPTTSRLVTGLFECLDLGPQTLKGVTMPLSLYQVVRESEARSRFEVAVKVGLTPLVGREEEVGLLRRHWERVKDGEGQVVLLSGEAGIGKSRLVQVLKEQVIKEGTARIEFRCLPYYQNTALYPIIEHLQRLLEFEPREIPQTKLAKLEQALAQYRFPQVDTLPLFASLLSLPHPEGAPSLNLSPQKQKLKTQESLVAWMMEKAERQAVCCTWEDLHWADPSTLEILQLFLEQVPTTRMLALLTFRPEFRPPWESRSHFSQITLGRLGHKQGEAMVEKVTGGKVLPGEVVRQIVTKTDGVPLFVEELTKMVVESGLLREKDNHYELTGPLLPLAIPSTLQDSLMARLDRLSAVREIAQLGATLGREFSYDLIHAVSPLDEETLQQGLRQLVDAELIYQRGLPPQAHYLFKHALVQETAYQSLLKSNRQQLHQQLAQVLEERFPETAANQPELLAHHYTEAGYYESAIGYWQRAGERALARSAHMEALSHIRKGLELCQTLPDMPKHPKQELALLMTLGSALTIGSGYTAPEVEQTYARARALYPQVQDDPVFSRVPFAGLYVYYHGRGEFQTAVELGEQLLSLAQRQRDATLLLDAHAALGLTLFTVGELVRAQEHLEQDLTAHRLQQDPSVSYTPTIGTEPGVSCLSFAGPTLWMRGYPDRARQRIGDALSRAKELSHPFSLALALSWAAVLSQLRREVQLTREMAEAAIALTSEQGFVYWEALSSCWHGWSLAEQGQGEGSIARLHQGMDFLQAIGIRQCRTWCLGLLAEAQRKNGRSEVGLDLVDEALTVAAEIGERFYEAELHRLKGELMLDVSAENQLEAETYFHHALEIARRQQAKSWELRAATSLARLWQQQGKKEDARQLLAEVYGWFSEGFGTADLQEAKALLDGLA